MMDLICAVCSVVFALRAFGETMRVTQLKKMLLKKATNRGQGRATTNNAHASPFYLHSPTLAFQCYLHHLASSLLNMK